MLFITGKTTKTWPAVVRVLAQSEELQMVALLYPGEEVPPPPFLPADLHEEVEPVTTWDDHTATPTARLAVNAELLKELARLPAGEFDLVVCRPGESNWLACAIPHEEMVLVRDHQLQEPLRAAGLLISTMPDSW